MNKQQKKIELLVRFMKHCDRTYEEGHAHKDRVALKAQGAALKVADQDLMSLDVVMLILYQYGKQQNHNSIKFLQKLEKQLFEFLINDPEDVEEEQEVSGEAIDLAIKNPGKGADSKFENDREIDELVERTHHKRAFKVHEAKMKKLNNQIDIVCNLINQMLKINLKKVISHYEFFRSCHEHSHSQFQGVVKGVFMIIYQLLFLKDESFITREHGALLQEYEKAKEDSQNKFKVHLI